MKKPSAAPVWVNVALLRVLSLCVITAFWEFLAFSDLYFAGAIPHVSAILWELLQALFSANLYSNLMVTGQEVGTGVLLGGTLGIVTGVTVGVSPFLYRAYGPLLYMFAAAPKIVYLPIMIMLLGSGVASKSGLGTLACYFPVALSVLSATLHMKPIYRHLALSMRLSAYQAATKVYIPATAPAIMNGLKLGIGLSIVSVLLGETKLSRAGIGFQLMQSYGRFNMAEMIALILLTFFIAIAINALLSRIELRLNGR